MIIITSTMWKCETVIFHFINNYELVFTINNTNVVLIHANNKVSNTNNFTICKCEVKLNIKMPS